MSKKVSNYNFEWDPEKAKQNLKKHKIGFERAANVFLDSNAVTIYDTEHDEAEERWITIGLDKNGNLIVVCHTFKQIDNDTFRIRLISARKPTKSEIRQYKELI